MRYAPKIPLMAPEAPIAGIIYAVEPPKKLKAVWNMEAATPAVKYKIKNLAPPKVSSMVLPKMYRKYMLKRI